MLNYGDRMEKSRMACHRVEEEGLSFREAERVVELELFLDEYPRWGLGTPHWSVILHEMFLHAEVWGQKEVEHMCHWGCQNSIREPNSEVDQSAMGLVKFWMSQKEIREVYHSVYLLNRLWGFPSCGKTRRRRAIQDILSSLEAQQQRWTYMTKTQNLDAHGREWELDMPHSYKAALWAAHQKALETAEALQSDLNRLDNEHRGRTRVHSQGGSRPRAWSGSPTRARSRGQSRDWARTQSQSHHHIDSRNECPHSPDYNWEPPNKRVSFHIPRGKELVTDRGDSPTEPSINDLELWLEHQAEQLGTPTWWGELEAIPGITDPHKFARKICVSFYVLEFWSRVSPGQGYSAPLAPRSLNRGAFLPEKLKYQDVRWWVALLTIAYCRCLQHWVEKHNPLKSPDCHPIAESVRELSQAVQEFMNITKGDILEDLEMEGLAGGCQPPSATIFNWVLGSPANRVETMPTTGETSQPTRMLRPRGRAHPFFRVIPARLSVCLLETPTLPTSPPTKALMVLWPSRPPHGCAEVVACVDMPDPTQTSQGTSMDIRSIRMVATTGISSISASRVVQDDTTRSIYMDTITTSIGRVVLSRPDPGVSSTGPTIEDVTEQE